MIRINKKKFLIAALVILLAGVFIGQQLVQAKSDTYYEDLKTFTQALEIVKRNYVENPDAQELIQGALRGMIASLDPHSSYMSERQFKEMNMDIKGEFMGVGIQIGIKNQQLTIIAPIEDTPGFRAGLAAGDKIIKINDEWTRDMTIEQAVDKMRGPKGTQVRLLIMRESWDKPKEFKIMRDVIKVVSVKSRMLDDAIGYVKIIQFQGQTSEELENALKSLEAKGMKKMVLDLRNDPGGLLDASVDVSGKFLPKDSLVVYLQGRQQKDRKDFLTSNAEAPRTYPIVVLVNTGSASASEIVSGALQDSKRALIVGTQTFGKGSVQTVFPLEGGGGLRLTTAKYYTPSGRSIQNVGITPDIEVKLPTVKDSANGDSVHVMVRERDLDRHLKNETLKEEKKKERPAPEEDFTMEMVPKNDKDDVQLQKAIEILKPAVVASDVFKNLPVTAKKEEKKTEPVKTGEEK
ncbi:MAG TPA: S41 family peptidase [Nitrospirota bacterium]|nr:S41 family peptidase [Nitrospirota bacterium]